MNSVRNFSNFELTHDSPVRFAICGVGHIGRRHAALVSRHEGALLVALIDSRADLQPGLAVEFPGVPFFLSFEEFLASGPAAEVLTVATPNGCHAMQAVAGLRHGLHVVVEKPIALSTTDAEIIVQTAQKTGKLVFGVMQNRYSPPAAWLKQIYNEARLGQVFLVQLNCFWNRDARYYQLGSWRGTQALDGGTLFTQFSHFVDLLYWVFGVMQNRYSPPAAWLKQVVDEGRLGQVFLVQLNCFWNRDARYYQPGGWKGTKALDGGTLFTQFSHFVDLLYWVFGDITNLSARFRDFTHAGLTEFEDSGLVAFDLLRGGSGTLSYSTAVWDRNLESSLTVVAERGSLRIAGQYMDKVEYCHLENYTLPALPPTSPANDYGPFQGSAANHVQVIENVVDTVQRRSFATTNALEGLKVVEIIERIYALR